MNIDKMEFVHSIYHPENSAPTKDTFIKDDDLNSEYDYPVKPMMGFWLSPCKRSENGITSPWIEHSSLHLDLDYASKEKFFYTLDPEAKIFHFRSAFDYLRAIALFPKLSNKSYLTSELYGYKSIEVLMDRYDAINKLEASFEDIPDKQKLPELEGLRRQVFKWSKSYKPITDFSDGYIARAFSEMKKHVHQKIREFSKEARKETFSSETIRIDYNAMREAGYAGFYIHQNAIDEACLIPKTSPEWNALSVFKFWGAESLCVWEWCFTDS